MHELYRDSNGKEPAYPRYYRNAEKKLAREQRKLSKMQKGSNNCNNEYQFSFISILHNLTVQPPYIGNTFNIPFSVACFSQSFSVNISSGSNLCGPFSSSSYPQEYPPRNFSLLLFIREGRSTR